MRIVVPRRRQVRSYILQGSVTITNSPISHNYNLPTVVDLLLPAERSGAERAVSSRSGPVVHRTAEPVADSKQPTAAVHLVRLE